MKIIHTSDIHLGSSLESNLTETQARIRRNELKQNFANLITKAEAEQVSAIIIAGDLFDQLKIPTTLKKYVLETIEKASDINFYFVQGNHELTPFADSTLPPNLFCFGKKWTTFHLGEITLCGKIIEEFNPPNLFDDLELNSEDTNILILHAQIVKGNAENTSYGINLNDLKNKNVDYLALGHIHEFGQGRIDDRAVYAYPGVLEGRGFDECGEKGFIMLDVNPHEITSTFVPFGTRQHHEIFADITSCESETQVINKLKTSLKQISKNDLIKLTLIGSKPTELTIDLNYLRDILNNDYFFVKLVDKTKFQIDLETLKTDFSLKGEFIRLVLENSDIEEETKNAIIELGIKALEGEEL